MRLAGATRGGNTYIIEDVSAEGHITRFPLVTPLRGGIRDQCYKIDKVLRVPVMTPHQRRVRGTWLCKNKVVSQRGTLEL